jgi:hypothetical protein
MVLTGEKKSISRKRETKKKLEYPQADRAHSPCSVPLGTLLGTRLAAV